MDKRWEVKEALEPIALPMGIKIDYDIIGHSEYLICNGQRICTSDTSLYGIRQEFFGYVFLREWRERSLGAFDKQTRNHIKRYWK